ncbi:MAG: hypothetical protein HZC54_16910 [Verrucomicrobia bacterium]|nr:hypothetical protein [Verrucomicrobiota bacterium]
MNSLLITTILLALSFGLAPATAADFLDARDCGASGSKFETIAATTAGSKQITVSNVGDFKVGQGVTVSRCNVQYHDARLWGPASPYSSARPLGDTVEIRGYDGSTGGWFVFILEVEQAEPATFRWSDNLVLHGNEWAGRKVPITFDWQKLSNGIEIKFKRQDWQPGHMVTFSARDQLISVVEKIEGKTLTLRDAANRTAGDAVVRHSDRDAIQAAINRAIREKRNVFFPAGHYRIPGGLVVKEAAIQIEGADGVNTVLDISGGNGACFSLIGGPEVTIRNFRMIGHTGLADAPGAFQMSNKQHSFWPSALKSCQAVTFKGTERVLIENVHASQMSAECFYSQGPGRTGQGEPKRYTKSLTFLRCSVTDCAANAFNNNDVAENTTILYCRVDGAGWQAYEGPGRFIKIIGNYIRNNGNGVWVGSMNSRSEDFDKLGCGQAIIADNVIEGIGRNYHGIWVERGASQVVIANNLFINFANNLPGGYAPRAIEVSSNTDPGLPAHNVTVTGNIIDLTDPEGKSKPRIGIKVSASGTIVSNNQIYVRGACDPLVTGISLSEPALDVIVHDNLIRNCGRGFVTDPVRAKITEVIDPTTFLCLGWPDESKLSHRYRGWNVAWLRGDRVVGQLSLADFDPVTLRYRLTAPRELKVGDQLEAFPPSANWNLHDNTITGCLQPVVLDAHGSDTSLFRNNLIERGGVTNATQAITGSGRFKMSDNHIAGFDKK